MRFNYFKRLINSALFCSFYVNARVIQTSQLCCHHLIDISKSCKENSYGFVSELEVKENAYIGSGVISSLYGLKKLSICGEQNFIQQYHLNEISTLESLNELHLASFSFSDTQFDMSVLENNTELTYLELSGFNDDSCESMNFGGFYKMKTLDVSKFSLTQSNINEISRLRRLNKMMIQIDENFSKLDISLLKTMKCLKSLYVSSEENNEIQYKSFASSFKGFNYLTELQLNSIKLSQTDINAIAGFNKLINLSMTNCDFSNSGISNLNRLDKLKYFKLTQARNIRGQTLTNKSLVKSEYQVSGGEFCIAQKMKGISSFTLNQYNYCNSKYQSSSKTTITSKKGFSIINRI